MSEPRTRSSLSSAERLAIDLAGRIERGEYLPDEWLPTERELAAEFRADRSTVRAALESLAKRGLIERNKCRRSLVCARTSGRDEHHDPRSSSLPFQTLAIISPQSCSALASPAIQRGVLHVLKDNDSPFHLIIFDNSANTKSEIIRRERLALESVRHYGIRGVILWHEGGEHTLPDIRRVQEAGIPIVLIDRRHPSLQCDFVGIDNVTSAREAVTYLLNLGHTRILHISLKDSIASSVEREQGFHFAMGAHGIGQERHLVYYLSANSSLQSQETPEVDYLLSLPETPTAIFAVNDMVAHRVTAALPSRGYKVPGRFSIVGFDDIDSHTLAPSTLTTVHQPYEQMGKMAVELLLRRLHESKAVPHELTHVLLATRIVIRSSCLPYTDSEMQSVISRHSAEHVLIRS